MAVFVTDHPRTMSSATPIAEVQQQIAEDFDLLPDWTDRYQYLIDLGRQMPVLPESERTEAHRVQGCQAAVWVNSRFEDGLLHFQAASDSAIVAGLISLLLRIYSGRTPQEILSTAPDVLKVIGLERHLSHNRANGLAHMLARIQASARHHQAG